MADVQLQALPPREAIEYFRGKGLQETFAWQDMWEEEHARAFTVAKAMRRDILVDIRDALDKAISEGRTFDQFKADLRPLLEEKGWWGKKPMVDPLTGKEREVQLGSARRLRTIFDVNLRSAYQAGRWQRIQASKSELPFLRYVAVQDSRTRPEHRAWHGTVLPVDDAWWDSHYPPCGFRCRCTVLQFNKRTLDRRGWPITEEPVKFPPQTYVNPRTGEATVQERGIDPGFNYNVGKSWMGGVTPRHGKGLPGPAAVASGGRPPIERRAAELLKGDVTTAAAQADFFRRFRVDAGRSKVFTDLGGEPFTVGPQLFTSSSGVPDRPSAAQLRGLALAAQTIQDPDEIRWIWTEGAKPGLQRRYLRRMHTGRGPVDAVVDTTVGGSAPVWSYRTSLDGALDLDAFRGGVLAWRRPEPEIMTAVRSYTGGDFSDINAWLRFGEGEAADVAPHIAGLDELLRDRRLVRDRVLFRGLSVSVFDGVQLRPGAELMDLGFMSTSAVYEEALKFRNGYPDGIILKILARRGSNALDISRLSQAGTAEYEVLFGRGTRLKVVGFDRRTRILTVETIVEPAANRE